MKQVVKLFYRCSIGEDPRTLQIDEVINRYLSKHPNYMINRIAFDPQLDNRCGDRVLVVFDVKEPPTYSVAKGEYSLENRSTEELKKLRNSHMCSVETGDEIDEILKKRREL